MSQLDRLSQPQAPECGEDSIAWILNGSIRFKELEAIDILAISDDVRLRNCFENSGATSVQQFLDMKKDRFLLRNYGKVSERKLIAGLTSFLASNPSQRVIKNAQEPIFNKKAVLKQVLRSRTPWREISEKLWAACRAAVKSSDAHLIPIYPATAQIGAYWPYSTKKMANSDTIEKYLDYSLSDLRGLRGFGRRKIGAYIACVIHFSDGASVPVAAVKPSTLQERILFAWENTNLGKREKFVIEHRFGIRMRKHTLEELASMLAVTRERVRQIEKKAIFKLRLALDIKETASLLSMSKLEIWDHLSVTSLVKKAVALDLLEDKMPFEIHLAIELCANRKHRGIKKPALGEWLGQEFTSDETNWYRDEHNTGDASGDRENIHSGLSQILSTL